MAIVPDQVSYLPGQTVTLSIVVDATGASDDAIFGSFTYDPAILLGGNASQVALTSIIGGQAWDLGPPLCPESFGRCEAFTQLTPGLPPAPVQQPAGFVISAVTFTAGAIGATNLTWEVGGPYAFDFFDLLDAPGATVTVVPEPATAALLAAGLVALGARRRARS